MKPVHWYSLARALAASLMLSACGGGVETGGTGAYVEGPVAGFGSVIVGGIRLDEADAHIEDEEGRRQPAAALRLGMRLEVDAGAIGSDADGGRSAAAVHVRIAPELLGPVTAIVGASPFVDVLGQSVRVTAATVVDGVPGGLPALAVGDIVEVHGFPESPSGNDRYVATRIERRSSAPAAFRVRGLVRGLDVAARTLRIGQQHYDLAATGVPTGLTNGGLVRLTVGTAQVGGRWPVLAITIESRRPADRDQAEVEGVVTASSSSESFELNGIAVDARGATFPDGGAVVAVGTRLKVRGRTRAGALAASIVELRSDQEAYEEGFDLRDALNGLDRVAHTFSVRGVDVFYGGTPAPQFVNGTAADLADGRRVRVRGVLAADRTRVAATTIEFVNGAAP
jgi:hypothetical protein